MSLSSNELNYLVWRYLEESGYELAAFAFNKQSKCLSYEQNKNVEVLSKVESGFLVNLVQKGILYSLAEAEANEIKTSPEILSLFGALLQEEKDSGMVISENNDMQVDSGKESTPDSIDSFITVKYNSTIEYDESMMSKWHPNTSVLASIKNDASLLISVLNDGKISETATLQSPGIEQVKDLTSVSWSPLGNLITTANTAGDICSWSPDGHLRNIVRGIIKADSSSGIIVDINWSRNGQYFLTIDTNGTVKLWNGTNLEVIDAVVEDGSGTICWLDDSKFAVSLKTFSIKVFSIEGSKVKASGDLSGHTGVVTSLNFSKTLRRLASYSSSDNSIRIWLLNSSSEDAISLIDTNSKILPLIVLDWTSNDTLISVSLNGVIRFWNLEGLISSTNIFKSESSYNFEDKELAKIKGSLVYAYDITEDGKLLALGDDSGRVSVWNIEGKPRCTGVFDIQELENEAGKGVSYVSWDKTGNNLSVSYNGVSSVIIKTN